MAGTVSVRSSLNVRDSAVGGAGNYQSQPSSFNGVVSTYKGPSPGVVAVPLAGVAVTFPQLVTPGYYRVMNLDLTNYVEYGIKDPGTGKFYPMNELLPGESYIGRFSRNLLSDYTNTGTGTDGDVNSFWFKANTAPVNILVEAFEA